MEKKLFKEKLKKIIYAKHQKKTIFALCQNIKFGKNYNENTRQTYYMYSKISQIIK